MPDFVYIKYAHMLSERETLYIIIWMASCLGLCWMSIRSFFGHVMLMSCDNMRLSLAFDEIPILFFSLEQIRFKRRCCEIHRNDFAIRITYDIFPSLNNSSKWHAHICQVNLHSEISIYTPRYTHTFLSWIGLENVRLWSKVWMKPV